MSNMNFMLSRVEHKKNNNLGLVSMSKTPAGLSGMSLLKQAICLRVLSFCFLLFLVGECEELALLPKLLMSF